MNAPAPVTGSAPWSPRLAVACWTLLLALLPGPQVAAQLPGMESHAQATLHSRVADGEVQVAIQVRIERGWHLYHSDLGPPDAVGLPTTVTLTGAGVTWSDVRFPEPEKLDQRDIGGSWIWAHEGTIVLHALGRLEAGADGRGVGAVLDGLTCEDSGACVPWSAELTSAGEGPDALFQDFPADLAVPSGGAGTEGTGDGPGSAATPPPGGQAGASVGAGAGRPAGEADWSAVTFPAFEPRSERPTRGLVAWLLVAFVAGMILNVMPCVLPVISIKVLSFVQQAGEDRRRILALGLAFAAGILVVFLVLATLAVTLGLSWGEQFQSQAFLVVMIGVVFAFALSLFGVFELGVPAGVGGLAGGPPREGMADAFFKGMLATVLATPCSGPFLGSTLTWTLAQPALVVFSIFASLGLGMALPYVVLTANPRLLKVVPRPGPWLETFKQSMGFVLLVTVVYLMISLRQDLLLFTAAFLVFVAFACWWWGRFSPRAESRGRRLVTLALSLALAAGGAWFSFGTLRDAFSPEAEAASGWEAFDPFRLEELLADGRSVFVDFTAEWCPNCKWNEKYVYEDQRVRALLAEKGVVSMKADITRADARTDMIERLMTALGARSIPFMAVFPGDRPFQPEVRHDIVGREDMLGILDALPAPGS